MTKCIAAGVSLEEVERKLDAKSVKVNRRKGDAKPAFTSENPSTNGVSQNRVPASYSDESQMLKEAASVPKTNGDDAGLVNDRIRMTRYIAAEVTPETIREVLQRPS